VETAAQRINVEGGKLSKTPAKLGLLWRSLSRTWASKNWRPGRFDRSLILKLSRRMAPLSLLTSRQDLKLLFLPFCRPSRTQVL